MMDYSNIPKPWLDTLKDVRATTLEYKDISNYEFLKKRAEENKDDLALIFAVGKTQMTYSKLYENIQKMAVVFRELGITKNDKVALMLPNTPHYVISHFALTAIGAVTVQANPLYTVSELTHLINDSGAKGIVTLTLFQETTNEVLNNTGLEWAIYGNVKDYFKRILVLLGTVLGKLKDHPKMEKLPKSYEFNILMKNANLSEFKESPSDFENDVAVLQYTGGTTGRSKGAMLTQKNISYNAQQARACIQMVPDGSGSVLTVLPMFHVFGFTACLNLSIHLGAPMILVPKFDAKLVLDLIEKYKVTFSAAVPTMLIALLNHPDVESKDLSSLLAVISGGAALPIEVAKKFKKVFGGDVVEGYGLSETSPLVTINPIGNKDILPQIGSIGLPAPDTYIKIVDINNPKENLKQGEIGELAVSAPQVMKGYYNRKEETENAFSDGWFLTGDIARIDEKGFTYIEDRKKDMIIVSGNNVYPREVEEVLFEHPKVLEAASAGLMHPEKGEQVAVWVVLKEGKTASEEEIITFAKKKLAPYKVPKKVIFKDELPKTMIGKILRRELKE